AEGTDVLLTTQYLEEADQLARHVVIIDHGRAIAAGTPAELKGRVGQDVLEVRPRQAADFPAVEEVLGLITADPPRSDLDAGTVSVTADRGAEQLTEALRLLVERQIEVDDIGLRRPSLDEAFLALTRRHPPPAPPETAPPALEAACPAEIQWSPKQTQPIAFQHPEAPRYPPGQAFSRPQVRRRGEPSSSSPARRSCSSCRRSWP